MLAFSCTRAVLKAGETLFVEGEPADAAYFVLAGEITLAAQGTERRVEASGLIGETALMVDIVRRASARAAVDVVAAPHSRGRFPARALRVSRSARRSIRAEALARSRKLMDELEAVRARAFDH